MVASVKDIIVKPDQDRACYTAKEVATALKINERVLRRMCAEGRVPFIKGPHDQSETGDDAGAWMLSPKSVAFLKRWEIGPGGDPSCGVLPMLMAAIKLDARCEHRANAAQPRGRVTPAQIKLIRELHAAGKTLDQIAAQIKVPLTFGGEERSISKSLVSLIVRGKRHGAVV